MNLKTFILFAVLIFPDICFGANIREIHVKTADCDGCGMTFLGELSIKVCAQGQSPAICCVAANLDNDANVLAVEQVVQEVPDTREGREELNGPNYEEEL